MKKQSILNYYTLFKKEPEGGFTVIVPSLPGCVTYGETFEEANVMAEEAISLYIESLMEEGEEIPNDEGVFSISVTLPTPRLRKKQYA